MTPLLSWSLRYVTCYAGDILAARAELDCLEATRNRRIAAEEGLDPAVRRLRQRQRALDYVASLRRSEERRVAQECVRRCSGRGSTEPIKRKTRDKALHTYTKSKHRDMYIQT